MLVEAGAASFDAAGCSHPLAILCSNVRLSDKSKRVRTRYSTNIHTAHLRYSPFHSYRRIRSVPFGYAPEIFSNTVYLELNFYYSNGFFFAKNAKRSENF